MGALTPADEAELREIVVEAMIAQRTLEIVGAASRSGLGRPVAAASTALSTRLLSGIVFYEPAELVIRARAGTPLTTICELLDAERQELAFEPIDHAAFYGGVPGGGTIGGLVAVGAAGPRRPKAGAVRDHLLGFRAVSGRGDLVKSGGRVMKNVTGFDLSKLMCGSHGTLAVLTEVTLKTLPKAETETTVTLTPSGEESGLATLREASALPLDVSGYALAPDGLGGPLRAHLRLEGTLRSVTARRVALLAAFPHQHADLLDESQSRALWRGLRDASPVSAVEGNIWRISTAPTDAWAVMRAMETAGVPILARFFDWVGGLAWIAVENSDDAHASKIRMAVDRFGGHATLVRATPAQRALTPVFHPQAPALAMLTRRVKDSFDPLHILNCGRVHPDF